MHLATLITASVLAADPVPPGPGSHVLTLEHGGVTRNYRLYVPKSYDGKKPVPLVFAFHGGGPRGTALTAERGLGFNPLADKHGFLACYPEGVDHHWNDGRVSPRFPKPEQDDVGFVRSLLAKLEKDFRIDPDRVYATGNSNGAFFSHRLGWELSDRLAAVAPSAGTLGKNVVEKFAPKHPVHVLHLHGTDDPAVPFKGGEVIGKGGECVSAADVVALWVKANGCDPRPKVEELPKTTDDKTKVRREAYAAGPKGAAVVFLAIEGHGHNFPGRPGAGEANGPSTKEVKGAEVVWAFFEKHPKARPAPPGK